MAGTGGTSGSAEELHEQTLIPRPLRDRALLCRRTLTRRRSTEELRTEFRNRFFDRLRISRSQRVDRFRQIVEDYGEELQYSSVTDLRLALLNDPEASELMGDIDVNEVLREIEQDIAQAALEKQTRQYEEEAKAETDDVLNRHLRQCRVCQELRPDEGEICAECQLKLSDDMESH